MTRITGDGAKPEQPATGSGAPPTDLASNLSVLTKFFYEGVYELHSGVRFLKDRNTIIAQLGHKSIHLEGLDPSLLAQASSARAFPREIVVAFTNTVIPQLIEPVKYQLVEEIRKFNETGPDKNSSVKVATIDSVDPLEFTIMGALYSGRSYYECTGTFTWNAAGNLTMMTNGKCHRLPVSDILRGQQGLLNNLLAAIGSL